MGTDIHPAVQHRVGGQWVHVPQDVWPLEKPWGDRAYPILKDRNYTLFAVLANVRNGFGFAGSYRHEPIQPIAEPRGLPEGFVHPEPYEDDLGDHSFSWVTLAELLAYDWEQPLARGCVVPASEFVKLGPGERPRQWSGGVMGRDIVTVSAEDYRAGRFDPDKVVYVQLFWTQPLREAVGPFVDTIIPWLQTLGAPDDVRLVFGFDS